MFRRYSIFFQLIAVAAIMLCGSCRRPEADIEPWNVDLLAPLAKTSLSLSNLINDSLFQKDSDSLLSLVYRYPIYEARMADFLKVPDTTIIKSVSLKNLELSPQTLTQSISLGTIASQSGVAGATIIANNG